ncbi:hypothetical protein F0562_027842 [Nyssa sinensis]|uniref:Uncharacterized protein n=1 Tax=Nyssa sinensis TaxID=561372 RepID=A0A5J5B510_9ASTE|nr:hypothetical protein F0562_027842 [Nyssa sinensis]
MEVSQLIASKILRNEFQLDETRAGTQKYNKISDRLSTEWTYYCLFKFAYFTFLLIFSLLSTSAVVYTIACIYTGREVTFKKVMSVVPKVWKRLMVTFVCAFIALFAYNVAAVLIIVSWLLTIGDTQGGVWVAFILYAVGFVYLTIVWQLASVVSVLEDAGGVKAMTKSKELIKGKMIGVGILCLLLLFKLFLFGLVIQTVLYFVCKSYHHENIDKSTLSDHLEVYLLGEYVPLKAKDVQLEQFDV